MKTYRRSRSADYRETREAALFLYECTPIDWWAGWTSVNRWLDDEEADGRLLVSLAKLLNAVSAICRGTSYEGTPLHSWMVSALPSSECYCFFIFAVKQPNNGTTYIASPVSLPWLETWRVH